MKILITGGAGFLGYHLAAALAARGDDVVLVDDLSRGAIDNDLQQLLALPNVRMIRGDLTKLHVHGQLSDDYDSVYHLAGIVGVRNVTARPDRVLSVNTRALFNVLEWFEGSRCGRFMFASTSEVYAWTMQFFPLPVPTPEDVPLAIDSIDNDRAAYALSKILGEMAVQQTCRRLGRAYTIVRYHNVYGPRMGMDHVIPELHARIRAGQQPLDVYQPDESRAFCYVADAVRATLDLTATNMTEGIFNVGNDREEITIRELARLILELAGAEPALNERERPGAGIARRCPDISRLTSATGFQPAVPLRSGLRETMDWYARAEKAAAQ